MISVRQMRAARALIGWKQSDIASASGLSLTAFNAIETEAASPRASTVAKIQQAYEESGVEFLPGDGLRMKAETFNIRTLEGHDTVFGLLDDVFDTLKRTGEHMRWFGVSEDLMIRKYRSAHFNYFVKMKEAGLREHCLCGVEQKQFYAPPSVSDYRVLPQELMGNVDYGVYGMKLCIGTFTKKYRVIIIEHEGIADAYRRQYDSFWKMAKPLRNYRSGFDEDLARLQKRS
jgi:transcriptional regulator with XRE-family HTH domain